MAKHKKLTRTENSDSWLGGVLGGFGKYLNIDPLILRILFIFITFSGIGSPIIVYIIFWLLMPDERTTTFDESSKE